VDKLLYRVVVRMSGILTHAWHLATARQILGPLCANLQPTASTAAKANLRWFMVRAWCFNPDLIPRVMLAHIPELEAIHVLGLPLPES
jgi:hypothetical protein